MFHKRLFPAVSAIVVAAGLVYNGASWASSYAVSTNSITGFSITGISALNDFTISGDFSVSLGALPGIEAHLSAQDAAPSCLGTYCSSYNNSFLSHGVSPSPGYAYADAAIQDPDVLAGTGSASAIGEVTVYDGAAGSASTNAMHAFFSLTSAGAVNFSFNALPFMSTQLLPGGTGASSTIGMGITIKKFGNTVFQWVPDGVEVGTEQDPFSLNYTMGSNLTYNPGSGFFSIGTNLLAGSYTLDIAMINAAAATSTTVVPVPAALPLFGSGVIALMALARRSRVRS